MCGYSEEQLKDFGFLCDEYDNILYEFDDGYKTPTIEFNTFEELIKFIDSHEDIVIGKADKSFPCDHDYTLEIYNGYRE
jgi:hypothetical protein